MPDIQAAAITWAAPSCKVHQGRIVSWQDRGGANNYLCGHMGSKRGGLHLDLGLEASRPAAAGPHHQPQPTHLRLRLATRLRACDALPGPLLLGKPLLAGLGLGAHSCASLRPALHRLLVPPLLQPPLALLPVHLRLRRRRLAPRPRLLQLHRLAQPPNLLPLLLLDRPVQVLAPLPLQPRNLPLPRPREGHVGPLPILHQLLLLLRTRRRRRRRRRRGAMHTIAQ